VAHFPQVSLPKPCINYPPPQTHYVVKNVQLLVLNLAARVVSTRVQGLMTRKPVASKCTGGKIRHRIKKGQNKHVRPSEQSTLLRSVAYTDQQWRPLISEVKAKWKFHDVHHQNIYFGLFNGSLHCELFFSQNMRKNSLI